MQKAGKEQGRRENAPKRCDKKRNDITYVSVVDGVIESCRAELWEEKGDVRGEGV